MYSIFDYTVQGFRSSKLLQAANICTAGLNQDKLYRSRRWICLLYNYDFLEEVAQFMLGCSFEK